MLMMNSSLLLRVGGRAGSLRRSWSLRRKTLDERDQLQQAVFADLPLKHRHDVAMVTLDDFRVGVENRFANVSLIRNHRASVVEHHRVSEHVSQRGAAALRI